jgi:hypothetical protein
MSVEAGNANNIAELFGATTGQEQSGQAHGGGRLAAIFQDIQQAVARTVAANGQSGYSASGDGRYVTGGVNWDGDDLTALISMVADQANPAQVDAVAELWRTHGASIHQSAENLTRSLNTLMRYWQGAAAAQAADSVARNANWITDVADTATKVAGSIEDASGALRSAQSTMPGAPSGGFWSGFGTAAGAAAAGAMIGGPFGAAAGAMVGGVASLFGFGDNEKKLKRLAVQTMQRYEQAAMGIDSNSPRFTEPSAGITGGTGDAGGTNGGAGSGAGTPPVNAVGPTGQGTIPPLTGQGTIPSFADNPGNLREVVGSGQAGAARRTGGHGGWRRLGDDLRWIDTGRGRFRLSQHDDSEWASVNPLARNDVRLVLRELAARVRS